MQHVEHVDNTWANVLHGVPHNTSVTRALCGAKGVQWHGGGGRLRLQRQAERVSEAESWRPLSKQRPKFSGGVQGSGATFALFAQLRAFTSLTLQDLDER